MRCPSVWVGTLALAGACSGGPPEVIESDVAPSPPPAQLGEVPTFDYTVGPGDVLRVNVFNHPELGSGLYRTNMLGSPVDGSGVIALPLVGSVPVNGRTVFQVQEDITGRLREYLRDPRVDVAVVEFGAHRIFVLGEVQKPGIFVLDRPRTALEALALAGGFTQFANREQVAIVHGPIRQENVALFSADGLDPRASQPVRSGDILYVGRRPWAALSQAAQDLVPLLQAISLPVSTARDVSIIEDIRRN